MTDDGPVEVEPEVVERVAPDARKVEIKPEEEIEGNEGKNETEKEL